MAFRPVADALANAATYQAKDMWKPSGNYNYGGSPALAAGNAMKPAPQVMPNPVGGGTTGMTPLGRVTNQAKSVQDTAAAAMKLASPSFPVDQGLVSQNVNRITRGQMNAQSMGLLPSSWKPNPANIIKGAQQKAYRTSLRNK